MSDDRPIAAEVKVQQSKSGRTEHGQTVVLHETSASRVVMIPMFIPRSSGKQLAIKVVTYKKTKPPLDWFMADDKSLSLDEDAARKLMAALQMHIAVAETGASGRVLVIKVGDSGVPADDLPADDVAKVVIELLAKQDVVAQLSRTELSSSLLSAVRGAIRVQQLRDAISGLRIHLDGGEDRESVYQDWCEKHSWAFGNAYVIRDEIRQISLGDKVDMLLPSVLTGYRDLIELKIPSMLVLNYDQSHNSFYFSSDVSKAIGQCHRYLDVLHEEAGKGMRVHSEIVAYHPRATIVVGRSNGWEPEKTRALHGLNRRLNGITVMTYDHLLAQGERLLGVVTDSLASEADEPEELDESDADIPF